MIDGKEVVIFCVIMALYESSTYLANIVMSSLWWCWFL